MNQDLLNRVQANLAKSDSLKVAKIEAETKVKSLQESLAQDLEAAKELGYNSLEELVAAQQQLEEVIKKECDEVEKAFVEAGV
jgi:hypothetical protein